jgi:FixJ family two-component response regulator
MVNRHLISVDDDDGSVDKSFQHLVRSAGFGVEVFLRPRGF